MGIIQIWVIARDVAVECLHKELIWVPLVWFTVQSSVLLLKETSGLRFSKLLKRILLNLMCYYVGEWIVSRWLKPGWIGWIYWTVSVQYTWEVGLKKFLSQWFPIENVALTTNYYGHGQLCKKCLRSRSIDFSQKKKTCFPYLYIAGQSGIQFHTCSTL